MNDQKVSPSEAWRLSALATTVSAYLRNTYGVRKFYGADEVEDACNECRVPFDSRQYAVAMFVEPEQSTGFLQRLGSSKTANELRKFMAQQVFFYYLPNTSFDSNSLDFHQAGEVGGATTGNFDNAGLDSGGDGGCDGGGGDGGD